MTRSLEIEGIFLNFPTKNQDPMNSNVIGNKYAPHPKDFCKEDVHHVVTDPVPVEIKLKSVIRPITTRIIPAISTFLSGDIGFFVFRFFKGDCDGKLVDRLTALFDRLVRELDLREEVPVRLAVVLL